MPSRKFSGCPCYATTRPLKLLQRSLGWRGRRWTQSRRRRRLATSSPPAAIPPRSGGHSTRPNPAWSGGQTVREASPRGLRDREEAPHPRYHPTEEHDRSAVPIEPIISAVQVG